MKRVFLLASLAVVLGVVAMSPEVGALCWASRACADGSSVSCQGTTCASGLTWVQCNGVRTNCPVTPCGQQIICPPPYPAYRLGCYSPNGTCSSTSTSVRCGSTTYTCAQCQSGAIACQLPHEP